MRATLVLQDGTTLEGPGFGAAADAVFELVFNTSLTGYQEILTDPSYRGQGVLFTAPHIGNVGVNLEDYEASAPQISAAVVRSISPRVSNWRSAETFEHWLQAHGVPGISGVDTRWLTRRLREGGTVKAALSTCGTPAKQLIQMANDWPGLDGQDMVKAVTCPAPYTWSGDAADAWVASDLLSLRGAERQPVPSAAKESNLPPHILVYDFGVKRNMIRHLAAWGARVTVLPAVTTASEALALQPDGILLSNGPGDPAGLPYAVEAVQALLASGVPIFGICLGHQLIGRALDGQTTRLKFGHHGGNHPVQDQASRKTLVTAQNHNYTVVIESLDPRQVELTHLSLNDGSLEGLRLRHRPVFSVQFHPEAAPGPHDAHGLFGEFFRLIQNDPS
jgi:carbamoyl-phosphate synthase small subunit